MVRDSTGSLPMVWSRRLTPESNIVWFREEVRAVVCCCLVRSITFWVVVSASSMRMSPVRLACFISGSERLMALMSCWKARAWSSSMYLSVRKSETMNATECFLAMLPNLASMVGKSVPLLVGWKLRRASMMRMAWLLPFAGGMMCSIWSVKRMSPTRS